MVHEGERPAGLDSWVTFNLGARWKFAFHPSTRVVNLTRGSIQVVLIGLPVDLVEESVDSSSIARRILDLICSDPGGRDEAIEYIAYLGGRFACLIVRSHPAELLVMTDCVASLPMYWKNSPKAGLAISPHASLCAKAANSSVDKVAAELVRTARKMKTPGTLFPPGTMTGYSGVLQILPNHLLKSSEVSSTLERYYPFPSTALESHPEESFDSFVTTFSKHVRLLSKLGPLGISLTGGRDSRATLAAAIPFADENTVAWTYYNSGNPHPEHLKDLEVAKDLAKRAGIAHRAVDIGAKPDPDFAQAVQATMGATAQMPRIPIAYHTQLPGNLVELQSMAAEVGTGFYKNRKGRADVGRLAELYARGPFSELPEVRVEMAKFIEYADFREDNLGPLDFHDLFYWEHRLGRWGSRRIQEVDLAHNVVLPFNARSILESSLGRPIDERHQKRDLVRYVRLVSPKIC